MSNPGFGKPRYGGGGNYTKNIRLQAGKNGEAVSASFRILPPMKSLAEDGLWAVYIGTHYGYKGVNTKDPSKPTYRPFKCIEDTDYKTKMVLQDCPECDLIATRKEEKENAEANAKVAGHSDDEIREIVKPLSDWLREHNCDRKWHMNVKCQDGSFAVLMISHKTKKKLDAKLAALVTEDGIDALELDQGVWFKFTRSGRGIDANDEVDVEFETVKDSATGRVARVIKLAPLTEAEAEKALKDCQDLGKSLRELTHEQIRLLTECSGEPEDVDAILAIGEKKEASPTARLATPAPLPVVKLTPPTSKPVVVAATPAPAPVAAAPVAEDDEEAAAVRALEAIKARKAAAKAAEAAQAVATQAPASDVAPDPAPVAVVAPTPAAAPAAGLPVDRAAFMAKYRKQ